VLAGVSVLARISWREMHISEEIIYNALVVRKPAGGNPAMETTSPHQTSWESFQQTSG